MNSRRPFDPVERSTISERIRDDIVSRIKSGELRPGTPLSAERVLADQFGVARTSVREAVQGLMAMGLIERRGNRSYVTEQVPGSQLTPSDGHIRSVRILQEARQVLELTLFELAATRATARQRNEIQALARMPLPGTREGFLLADRQFHAAIATACGNPALVEVYGRVLDSLADAGAADVDASVDLVAAVDRAGSEHRRIADALVAGDTAAVLAEVERHLGPVPGRGVRVWTEDPGRRAARRTVGL